MNRADEFNPQSMDAVVWAKEFMRIYNDNHQADPGEWIDEDLMRAWFANSIMAGFDEAKRREEARMKPLREALECLIDCGRKDLSNPKYDGYFDEARQAIKQTLGVEE